MNTFDQEADTSFFGDYGQDYSSDSIWTQYMYDATIESLAMNAGEDYSDYAVTFARNPAKLCFLQCIGQKRAEDIVGCEYTPEGEVCTAISSKIKVGKYPNFHSQNPRNTAWAGENKFIWSILLEDARAQGDVDRMQSLNVSPKNQL